MNTTEFKTLGDWLNQILKPYNYQVAPLAPAGKPGKILRSSREFRLQLINKQQDTSDNLIKNLGNILKGASKDILNIKFNSISPNSSKFPSYNFDFKGQNFDLVIARGANKGENFETKTVADLASYFKVKSPSPEMVDLVAKLDESNKVFRDREIASVRQRTGSTKKEGIPIENLGAIIGDIILTDTTKKEWYISLKDANGSTFSSYSGAASLFNAKGDLQPNSPGAEFLNAFGVDLNKVQAGFDTRNKLPSFGRPKFPVKRADTAAIKAIFERAWGMNYFYVRRMPTGWKVFWLDRNKLDKLAGNIKIYEIKYPSATSKQISIICGNNEQSYLIELRNSKAGEYPNDTKFKVR
jgi:hypothetical protein